MKKSCEIVPGCLLHNDEGYFVFVASFSPKKNVGDFMFMNKNSVWYVQNIIIRIVESEYHVDH